MSTFDDKIYSYFTQRSNFRAAFEIASIIPDVEGRLVNEFWELTLEKLTAMCDASNFKIKSDLEDDESTIELFSEQWGGNLSVYYSGFVHDIQIRVWINQNEDTFDREKIYELVKKDEAFRNFETPKIKDISWNLGSFEVGDSFEDVNSLEKILPDVRDSTAQLYAKRLYEMAEKLDSILVKINGMRK